MKMRMPINKKQKKIAAIALVSVLVLLIGVRVALPFIVTDYVNKVINRIDGYSGSIADVDIHLYRGAYTIYDLKLFRGNGDIPVPFIDIAVMDLSVEWGALLNGAVVGEVSMDQPKLNFAVSKNKQTQTGVETDWTQPIRELMPLDINRADIHNGTVAYKDFSAAPQVDIYITDLNGEVLNLRNAEDKDSALPSHFNLSGTSIGGGTLSVSGDTNILKRIPDFDMDGQLENISLPAMNDYSQEYAAIDFTEGTLHIYTELAVNDGQLTGYVKPLARNISIVDSEQDDNPLNYMWETIASVVIEVFENQSTDQFATRIELQGDLSDPETNFWSTLTGIVNNAFVRAFSEGTDGTIDFNAAKNKKE